MNTIQSPVPLVSIGLAVRNGALYLAQALDSILAQTFTDFEVIISDNASTDATEDICRQYAQRDGRIRYSRNLHNIGGANNENRTVQLARGKYFRRAAHDDMLAPKLLEKCAQVLEQSPNIALCYLSVVGIDELGRELDVTTLTKGTSSRAELPAPEKALCYAATARWSVRQSARLIKEAAINAYDALHSKGWRITQHAQVHNWE